MPAPEPPPLPRSIALVPAAGSGYRFGSSDPKQFLDLHGRPVLAWTLQRLLAAGLEEIAVAVPADHLERARNEIDAGPAVHWVVGGESRQESVAAALAALPGDAEDLVLVHDGARPAVWPHDVRRTLEAAATAGGAVLGRPVRDTLKRVTGSRIVETVDRRSLFHAETPQVFHRHLLAAAFELARNDGFQGTDEAALVERLEAVEVRIVLAERPNPKLTEPADLDLVRQLLAENG